MAELITEPRVIFERLPNPKFGIVPGALTRTVFFGTSKPTLTVKNEQVTRGGTANGTDTLANKNVDAVTKIFDEFGVVYFESTDFVVGNVDSPTLFGQIQWSPTGGSSKEPAAGVKYFVTYEVNKDLTTYTINEVDSVDQAEDLFGSSEDITNRLSVAARIYFNNGAVRGLFLQIPDTTSGSIQAALDALTTIGVDIIVPLIGAATGNTVVSKVKAHVFQQSQSSEGNQRIALLAGTVGTTTTDFKTMAAAAGFERLVFTAPGSCFVTLDNVSTEVDGTFLNAAIAGFLSDPDNDVAVPITRKELFEIDDVGVNYTKTQANDLVANGLLVVEFANSVVRVRHGITTDITNLNSNELSVVRISDFLGSTLRSVLEKIYIGTKIDPTAIASIRTTIETVLNSFIKKVIIVKFDNLNVSQNVSNPVVIDVSFRVFPVYPLNLIDIKFSFDVF